MEPHNAPYEVAGGAPNLPVPAGPANAYVRALRLAEAFAETRISEHTRDAYHGDLHTWITWTANHNLDPFFGVRPAHIGLWLADLRATGLSDATCARRLSAVSSWYRWLIREGVAPTNPVDLDTKERPAAHRDRSPTAVLTTAQAERLLDAADIDGTRTAAIVAILIYTGVRIGELISADVADITIHRGQPILDVLGKGRRRRTVPLPGPAYARIQTYLEARRGDHSRLPAVTVAARGREPLIATSTGARVDRSYVRKLLRRLARNAGGDLAALVERISPHSLRHSYATDLIAEGVPIRDVQYAMGHAGPVTTERYDHGQLHPDRHPTYRRAAQVQASTDLTRLIDEGTDQ